MTVKPPEGDYYERALLNLKRLVNLPADANLLLTTSLADGTALPEPSTVQLPALADVAPLLARRAEPMMEKSAAALRVLPWWGQGLALVAIALLIMELAPAGMPGFIYFGF